MSQFNQDLLLPESCVTNIYCAGNGDPSVTAICCGLWLAVAILILVFWDAQWWYITEITVQFFTWWLNIFSIFSTFFPFFQIKILTKWSNLAAFDDYSVCPFIFQSLKETPLLFQWKLCWFYRATISWIKVPEWGDSDQHSRWQKVNKNTFSSTGFTYFSFPHLLLKLGYTHLHPAHCTVEIKLYWC